MYFLWKRRRIIIISIKPDLSPEGRKTEAVLLKERWRLIQSGTLRNFINIRNHSLYINDSLHGSFVNFEFKHPSPPSSNSTINVPTNLDSTSQIPSSVTSTSNSQDATSQSVYKPVLMSQDHTISYPTHSSSSSDWLPNDIPTCLWNLCSLSNKLSNFQSFVYSSLFKLIAITETWLTDSIYNNELLPSGFDVYCKDRNNRGGGVLLAVHQSILSPQLSSPNNLEVISSFVNVFSLFV